MKLRRAKYFAANLRLLRVSVTAKNDETERCLPNEASQKVARADGYWLRFKCLFCLHQYHSSRSPDGETIFIIVYTILTPYTKLMLFFLLAIFRSLNVALPLKNCVTFLDNLGLRNG